MRKKHKEVFLSIVIPVFNEEKRIDNLKKIIDFSEKQKFASELVVVNDGSSDNTLKKIRGILSKIPKPKKVNYEIISYDKNRGKGYAVKTGMLKARGTYRLFMDIDLSTPLTTFEDFKKYLAKYDVVIGSRKTRGAKLTKKQSPVREYLGKGFTKLSQVFLNIEVTDFTCGYKCFSSVSAKKIFSKQLIERWGFDSEILFLAKTFGFNIKEVPVSWKDNSETKVKFPQDIMNSLSELIKIRLNHLRKRYTD